MILATLQVRRWYRLLIICHLLLHGPAIKESLSHIIDNETSQIGDELSDGEEEPNVLVSSVKEKVTAASNK
jgi:hypothetical protein